MPLTLSSAKQKVKNQNTKQYLDVQKKDLKFDEFDIEIDNYNNKIIESQIGCFVFVFF